MALFVGSGSVSFNEKLAYSVINSVNCEHEVYRQRYRTVG